MKNKMRKKAIILMLSMLMAIPFGSKVVYANNYIDSPYTFQFTTAYEVTAFRPKQDDSYSYMHCKFASRSYTAHVVSRSTQTGILQDCSYGRTYQFESGTTHPMLNSVWERGYREAAILATRDYAYSYSANGDWSPDSIGY